MKTPTLRSFNLIAKGLDASLSLQVCNMVADLGKDMSAKSNAVTDTAEENKEYRG